MHSYAIPAQHVVVVRDRQIYNFYVVQVFSNDAIGRATNSIVIDRNRPGNDAWLLPAATAKSEEALRKSCPARQMNVVAALEVFRGLSQ